MNYLTKVFPLKYDFFSIMVWSANFSNQGISLQSFLWSQYGRYHMICPPLEIWEAIRNNQHTTELPWFSQSLQAFFYHNIHMVLVVVYGILPAFHFMLATYSIKKILCRWGRGWQEFFSIPDLFFPIKQSRPLSLFYSVFPVT